MTLLNASNAHLWFQGRDPEPLEGHHHPTFLAYPRSSSETLHDARRRLVERLGEADDPEQDPLAKIHAVGEPIEYKSFWNHGETREVIPVAAKRPYWVPDVSDALFFDEGFYTAEHDIPYIERVLADMCAEKDAWILDTRGRPTKLNVLTYDIETTQYGKSRDVPIDMIGYSHFDVEYEASKDLDTEAFDFSFRHLPSDWKEREVTQLVARNRDEEIDHLEEFTQHAVRHDIISGHNVLGFDNKQIHERLQHYLSQDKRQAFLSPGTRDWFERFTTIWSRPDRSFHFGTSQDICNWYPMTLDTFHAARKFYFFHDDFSLKGLAPWLGIDVPDRVYMEPADMALDKTTLRYNKHDVQEQTGVTMSLIAQALPLCFTVNLPMESLLTGGNTKMWDHMAFMRARRQRRMMPATCRAQAIAGAIHRHVGVPFPTREEVAEGALAIPEEERNAGTNKEFIRVAKQGPEMPFWCEHPEVILRPKGAEGDPHGYAIAGGLTLKPDSDLQSHFVPWFHVVEADVGAMYPTILKARNLTADTVRPAKANETPDDWIWLRRLDERFASSGLYHVRDPDETEGYTRGKGKMIGVKHNAEAGMVNLAMTGVLDTIQKVKDARAQAKREGRPKEEVKVHDMTYASLKAARNAGTHGILVAVNVSCRQFNVWGGANITTIGQKILHDTLEDFKEQGIRVVYGDTDGIYLGCSRSAGNTPHVAAALGVELEPNVEAWITLPDQAIEAVNEANKKWRTELDYRGFELEAEVYDAMLYIVHKNYLKFNARDGVLRMETKGNNFKGSDKAPLARHQLEDIMRQALAEVAEWTDEEDARERMRTAIKRATRDRMQEFRVHDLGREELTLTQSVRPIKSYKPNPDGTLSNFAVRTVALEQVLGESIAASRKMRFVICKDPLPLYSQPAAQEEATERLKRSGHHLVVKKPRKSGIKPIEYMWPVEKAADSMIDWAWYKEMVENYVKGAFGLDTLELATQRDLSSWF